MCDGITAERDEYGGGQTSITRHPLVDHFFQRPLDEHPQRLACPAAPGTTADEAAIDQPILDVDDLQVAAVALQHGPHVFVDGLVDFLGELVGRNVRRVRPGRLPGLDRRRVGQGDLREDLQLPFTAAAAPGFVQQVLQAAGNVVAGHARPAGLDGIGDLRNGAEVELLDLAADVRLAERETLADDAAFVALVGVQIDAQLLQIDAAPLGPIENGGLQRLGPHHRAVDLLLRQTAQEIDDVLVADLEGLDRRKTALLDQRA